MNSSDIRNISSVSNPRIKSLVRLRDRTHRDRAGLLLIEGYRELLRAVDAHIKIKEVYFCEQLFLKGNEYDLIKRAGERGATVFSLSKKSFQRISYRDRPDGLIATAPQVRMGLSSLRISANPLLVITESIEKPGNLGSILRSSDAAGADGVIVCDPVTDINNPNVVRASTGTLFTLQVVEAESAEVVGWLRSQGIRILAATPGAKMIYTEVDFTKPVAIAVGAEQYGLTPGFLDNADINVSIPMAGAADSLNVAIAATVLLFEAARQRGFPKKQ